jgi:hypothetical protein
MRDAPKTYRDVRAMYWAPTKRRSVTRFSPTHVQSNFAEQRLSYHDVDVNAGEPRPP